MGNVELGTIYDINKAIYHEKDLLPETLTKELYKKVYLWFKEKALCGANYYMFLCRDRQDYTIFNFIKYNPQKGLDELKDLINSRGKLKDIVYNEKYNYYEFWIYVEALDKEYLYILFPCDDFIIEIGD